MAIARGLRSSLFQAFKSWGQRKEMSEKETTRGRGKVFFSPSSLAPHSTIRTPGTGFLRSSKKHVLYMPPSVNDLELRSLREGVSYFFSFCNKEKRRRLYAGQCLSIHEYVIPQSLLYSRYFENGPLEPGYFQRPCSQVTFRVIPNQTFSLSISSSNRACSCSCSTTKSFS